MRRARTQSVPSEECAQVARERILQAARRIFAERGFDDTSTKAIAEKAGVPSGLVFYYFGSKESLLDAVFDGANITHALAQAFEQYDRIDDPREALALIALAIYRWLDDNKELAQIFFREITSHRPIARRLRQMRNGAIERIAGFLDGHIAAGRLPSLNTRIAAQALGSSILLAVVVDRPADPSEFAHALVGLFLR